MTLKQAADAFGVTNMTIFSWRKAAAGRDPLPVILKEGSNRVFVPIAKARAWATKYNLAFKLDGIEEAGRQTKPGPKPKASKPDPTRKGRAQH